MALPSLPHWAKLLILQMLLPIAAWSQQLYTTSANTLPGLTGSYFNQVINSSTAVDLRLFTSPSGSRVDPAINFNTATWGARSQVGVTGGSDADWSNFSVQWDGWIDVATAVRLTLSTDDGSRLWIDLNGDGVFELTGPEFLFNGWGAGQATTTAISSLIQPGLYRLRVQYTELSGGTIAVLGTMGETFPYQNFDGNVLNLYPWEGRNVVYLTEQSGLDPAVMAKMLAATDAAYDYYRAAASKAPTFAKTFNRKLTIAQTPTTCGAGCGYLGFTGIELLSSYFVELYEGIRLYDEYAQVVFYELGRNFWFYDSQAAFKSPDSAGSVITGFAVGMRLLAMQSAGVTGGTFGVWDHRGFRDAVEGLADAYARDPSKTFANTLQSGTALADNALGTADLFASIFIRLHRDFGGDAFIRSLWPQLGLQPTATTTQDAVDNFIRAASRAAKCNLSLKFEQEWKFTVPSILKNQLQAELGNPVPPRPAIDVLVPANATWKYRDDATGAGINWQNNPLADAAWASGPAPLGFGDPGMATTLASGPTTNRYPAFYFRHRFMVPDPNRYEGLSVRIIRDDSLLLYLNGQEVIRDNLPRGTIINATLARGSVDGTAETRTYVYELPASLLRTGENVISAEVHQTNLTSSDLSFSLALEATRAVIPSFVGVALPGASQVGLSWSEWASVHTLEFSDDLQIWAPAPAHTPVRNAGNWNVNLPLLPTGNVFYRLTRVPAY